VRQNLKSQLETAEGKLKRISRHLSIRSNRQTWRVSMDPDPTPHFSVNLKQI
jgi:hypothetical protein